MTIFINPSNNHEEEVTGSVFIWCLLFGTFYFLYKNVWSHALISFVAALLTSGISWLLYPFFAKAVIEQHYRKQGWKEKDASSSN